MRTAALKALANLPTARGANVAAGVELPSCGEGVWAKEDYVRQDKRDDASFYNRPRMGAHMSPATLEALTGFYAERLPGGAASHLDVCSSFASHLPESYAPARCVGLGMNLEELQANPALTEHVVQNLNKQRELPFEAGQFDAATNVASVEYITKPLVHFEEVRRVLAPGAPYFVAFTTRAFWTKATKIWTELSHEQRMVLVAAYFASAGFTGVEALHVVGPDDGAEEPLAVVVGRA